MQSPALIAGIRNRWVSVPGMAPLRVFLVLRMIVLTLVVGMGIMIMQFGGADASLKPLYGLLILSCIVGGVHYAAVRLGVRPPVALWALMIVDIGIESAIMHYSGGAESQFSLIFCLSIVAAAFLLRVQGGLGIALLASIAYIGYGLLESKGMFFPPGVEGRTAADISTTFLETYMHVSVFFLVGAVGGYLAERINRKGRQLDTAEAEIQRLRISTDTVLRNMSSGVLVIDSIGKILTINPTAEDILGIRSDDAQDRDVEEVFGETMPELSDELVGALTSEQNRIRHELTVRRNGGSELPLGISISMLREDDGEKNGIITVFQDLTEVRNMQERVRKADRLAAIGELSAGIAHELRNPLASISGSIEMLAQELDLNGENRRLMELIIKESDRLDRIITDFLEFARLRTPAKEDVSVEEVIEEMVVLLKNNAGIKTSIMTYIEHDTRYSLSADEEQIKQVLLNLAINACDAMKQAGAMTITSKTRHDGSLAITFGDEGEGISQEAMDRLFEPFFTTKEGGTGLGLAIANKIVEAHGGSIEVGNRDGGGAEVEIIFPREALRKRLSARQESNSLV